MTNVRLHIDGYPDSDEEERAELAWALEDELRSADIDAIARPSVDAPPLAKGNAFMWAQLLVSVAGTLPALVSAALGWANRHPGASVTVEIDGDTLTLDSASTAEREELIRLFLDRHARA